MQNHKHKKFCKLNNKTKKIRYPRHRKSVLGTDEYGFPTQSKSMRKNYLINGLSEKNYDWDYISLMSRFLMSHVGKKWDDVYSEICRDVDHRSREGIKTKESIDIIVVKNCHKNDSGEIIDENGDFLGYNVFYVESGILGYIPRKHVKAEKEQKVFDIDGIMYHCHNGNWYRVKMQTVPENSGGSTNDVFVSILSPDEEKMHKDLGRDLFFKQKYGLSPDNKVWYCCEKQSAGKRDIKRLKTLTDNYQD